MLEKKVEGKLVAMVRNAGGKCLKFESPGTAGVPDRIVMMPHGKLYFVELKAPGERPRPLQLAVHAEFESLGFTVRVLDTPEAVAQFVEEITA